jgi:Tfp pilus assembly protein PilF
MVLANPLNKSACPFLRVHRGLAFLALGQLLEAEEDFAEALRTAPSHAHYPHYRAVVHGRKVRTCAHDS